MKIVSVVGMAGAGKSEVARVFEESGFVRVRFGDVTDDEIKNVITWQYQCKGCARIFDKKEKECPICGSQLRFKPKSMKQA